MIDDLRAWLSELGFPLENFQLNDKWHHFSRGGKKKKNCYFIGSFFLTRSGKEAISATVGDFATGEEHCYQNKITLDEEERKRLKEAENRLREARAKELQRKRSQARKKAAENFRKLPLAVATDYLNRKKIDPTTIKGLVGTKDYTLIPVMDMKGELWGAQRIGSDGERRFSTGTKKEENFCPIPSLEDVKKSKIILVAEGFATAYSCWQASDIPSVAAFDCGNLESCGKAIKRALPGVELVFCADNDQWKQDNVGIKKAKTAAKATGGKVCWPNFKSSEGEPTDFNDLLCIEGSYAVKRIIKECVDSPEKDGEELKPLGYMDGTYYYLSLKTQNIIPLSAQAHRPPTIFRLATSIEFFDKWATDKGSIDWNLTAYSLMNECHKKGIFDLDRVRQVGCWNEGKELIVHLGNRVWRNGEIQTLSSIKSRDIYQLGKTQPDIHPNPLSREEGEILLATCRLLSWNEPIMADLLAGFFTVFRVAGALPWRPHCWVTGAAGAGKSTVIDDLADNLAGDWAIRPAGSSSEAGIRQHLKTGSVPIIVDESESDDASSRKQIQKILQLARQASSHSKMRVLRGTPEGKGHNFYCNSSFLMSSINESLREEADRTRFLTLERSNNHVHDWKTVVKPMLDQITPEYGERLFSRVVRLWDNLRHAQDAFQGLISEQKSSRVGQQYGTVLAGLWVLCNDDKITESEARSMLVAELWGDEVGTNQTESDQEKALNHLITCRVRIKDETMTIGQLVEDHVKRKIPEGELAQFGLRVDGDRLFIAAGGHELQKIYRDTKWEHGWAATMRRLDGADKKYWRLTPGGRCVRGVLVPFRHIF